MKHLPRLAARLIAALVVAAVMAGPVIAVAAAAGNPLPADLLERLGDRSLDDAAIVKVLSLGFYLCWAWFCAPALRQLWAALGSPRRSRLRTAPSARTAAGSSRMVEPNARGPRGWLAGLARFAVTGVIAASSVAPAPPPAAGAAPAMAVATVVTPVAAAAARTQAPAPKVEVTALAASHRDTPYALARRLFAPGRVDAVRDAIVELNIGRPLPDGTPYRGGGFPLGWTVLIPAGSDPGPVDTTLYDTVDGSSGVIDTAVPVEVTAGDTVVADAADSAVTMTVRDGDNLWDLSVARHEQAGVEPAPGVIAAYVAEVAAVNADQVDDPNLIYTGQQLVLPAVTNAATSPAPPPPDLAESGAPVSPDGAQPVIHVIGLGDTLWDVLEGYHGHVDAHMIWHIADLNGIEDPSNIPVGTPLIIAWTPGATLPAPQPDANTPPPAAKTPPPAPATTTVADTPPASSAPAMTSPPTAPRPAVTLPPVAEPARPPVTAGDTSRAAPLPAEAASSDDDDGVGLFEWSPRSVWAAIPVGVSLAAGLAGMTRRLRARRLSRLVPGEQLAAPPPVAAGTELAVSASNPQRRLSTLQGLLRTVTPYAREHADPPAVRAIELDDDRIEVLFAAPAPFPPHGWTSIDGGASWVHRLVDVAPTSVRQLVTPALVTLGLRSGGGEVLLDLETAGSMALAGERTVAQGMARAMALELATYPLGVAMDVCLIGFDVDGTELCDRTWKGTTLTRAVRAARDVLDRTAATGAASLVAARAATDDDEALLDPQVFLVDTDGLDDDGRRLLDELVALCTPQSGAAVVIIGDHPAARERVEVVSADTIRWVHSVLRPTALDREAVAQVAVMFDHAASATAEPLAPSTVVADLLEPASVEPAPTTGAAPAVNGDLAGPVPDLADDGEVVEPYRYHAPPFEVLVRVLGQVAVEGRPITAGVDVEMLALLAFKRDQPPNVDTLRFLLEKRRRPPHDAVDDGRWAEAAAEAAVKTLRNRASALRRNLGVGADGEDLLPRAAQPGAKGRYQLSPRVLTDVDLIEHRFHTATGLASSDALALLRDGLVWFAGPAFRGGGDGYGWIGPEGVLTRITNVVIAYATLLMELAFDADDLALVLQAAAAAGRVIDDPVALMPMSQVQRQFAEASGDPDLTAAVVEAHRRLRAHADAYDPLAGD